MMSRSRTRSFRRRTLPASLTCSAAGCSRSTDDDGAHGRQGLAEERLALDLLTRRGERVQDVLLGLRRRGRVSVRSRSDSAACRSSSIVETPSSCQMRRAVFGPEPRHAHELDDVGRDALLALGEGGDLPVVRRSGRSSPRSPCRSRRAPSPCPRRRAGRSSRRSRACAAPRGGRRAAELVAALELEEVGEQLELIGDLCVARKCLRHHRDDMAPCGP